MTQHAAAVLCHDQQAQSVICKAEFIKLETDHRNKSTIKKAYLATPLKLEEINRQHLEAIAKQILKE